MDETLIEQVIEAGYAGALAAERWPDFLARLAGLFRCHFADSFARSEDYTWFAGTAFGLDEDDYQNEFLGKWVKRNVWGRRHPVRVPGEIVTTRHMVQKGELLRSDMHREYLGPRDLDEGLRLALRVENGCVQDISLLRPWSAGPFDEAELGVARAMLPHLQRCAAIASRLEAAQVDARAAEAGLEALRHPVLLLDAAGIPIRWNRAADHLLAGGDGLALEKSRLRASQHEAGPALDRALRRAAGMGRRTPRSASLALHRPSGRAALRLNLLPIPREERWSMPRGAAVLLLVDDPADTRAPLASQLAAMFGLTEAEADIARQLAAGRSLREIADATARSPHTIRTLLARAMRKTGTTRQADLVRLLITLPHG